MCWADIFIQRLRSPPGSWLTRGFAKLLIHSRLKRNAMTISHNSYPLFLTFLTDAELLLSALLPQFFLWYHGISILCPSKIFLQKVGLYRPHCFRIRNFSCILLRPQWHLSLGFSAIILSRERHAWRCFWTFSNNSEQFFGIKIDFFLQKLNLALCKSLTANLSHSQFDAFFEK